MNHEAAFQFKEIRCPVCGADESKFRGWRGGAAHHSGAGVKTAIVRCRKCSHQYPNPMPFPKGDLDELYVDADEYFSGHDVEEKKQNGLGLLKEFEKRLGRKGRLLDIGCGTGEIIWAAKELNWDYVGIDPSREFIETARRRLGVEGRVTTLEDAGFGDESFEAIVMSGIVEHLYNPLETLREVRRVLKRDGWFWFDAPNEDGLYMQIGNLYMKLRGKDWVVTLAPTFPPYHVQGFNPRSVRELIERAGFKLVEMDIFGEFYPQKGAQTFRRKIENSASRFVNWLGNSINKGTYMSMWVQKK